MALSTFTKPAKLLVLFACALIVLLIGLPSEMISRPLPPIDGGGGGGGADAPKSGQPVPGQWIVTFHRDNLHALQVSSTDFDGVGPSSIRQEIISRLGAESSRNFDGDISFALVKMPPGQVPNLAAVESAVSMGAVDIEPNRYISSLNSLATPPPATRPVQCPNNDCTERCKYENCTSLQWALKESPDNQHNTGMNVEGAWQISRGAPDQVIAVVSDGVDTTLSSITNNLWINQGEVGGHSNRIDDDPPQSGEKFYNSFPRGIVDDIFGANFANLSDTDDLTTFPFWQILPDYGERSGSIMSGLLVADPSQSPGLHGVIPNAKILNVKVTGDDTEFTDDSVAGTLAEALIGYNYVLFRAHRGDKIRVLVNDWTMDGFGWSYDDDLNATATNYSCPNVLVNALKELEAANILVVTGSGQNEDFAPHHQEWMVNIDSQKIFPASCKFNGLSNILVIAPSDTEGNLLREYEGSRTFLNTNYGPNTIDISAPGDDILALSPPTINNEPRAIIISGNLPAVANAAGVAALVYSVNPDLTPKQVIDTLVASGTSSQDLARYTSSGKIVNAFAALTRISQAAKITGIVTAGGYPVEGVAVRISPSSNSNDTRITGSDGRFTFFNLTPGDYILSATKENLTLNGPIPVSLGSHEVSVNFHTPTGLPIFTVEGRVSTPDSDGSMKPLSGVELDGHELGKTTSATDGYYRFITPQLGNYTITPAKAGFLFTPSSLTINLTGSVSGRDFGAFSSASGGGSVEQWYRITGRVMAAGAPVAGAIVQEGPTRVATNANGAYSIFVEGNGVHTLSVSAPGYSFNPNTRSVDLPNDDFDGHSFDSSVGGVDFLGGQVVPRSANKYKIGGAINSVGDYSPFSHYHDVVLYAADGKTIVQHIRSLGGIGTNQQYYLNDVSPGRYYVYVTSLKPGYRGCFTNNWQPLVVDHGDVVRDFFERGSGAACTLSGVVTDTAGQPLSGVLVSAPDPYGGQATHTDSYGFYTIGRSSGQPNIQFLKAGYYFQDLPINLSYVWGDAFKQYTGHPTHLTAKVVANGSGVKGVEVKISQLGGGCTTIDDGSCTIYVPPGTYTLTVTPKRGFVFSPAQAILTVNEHSWNGGALQIFNAEVLPKYHIAGRIALSGGQGANRVSISVGYETVTTDRNGSFSADIYPGSYTLLPSSQLYSFSPATRLIQVSGNMSGLNFTAQNAQYVLSGRVMNGISPVSGATVREGSSGVIATTDSQGHYAFGAMPPTTCRLSVEKLGLSFAPVQLFLDHSQVKDFVANTSGFGSIYGRVTRSGSGVGGVVVGGPSIPTVVTDRGGYYTIPNVRNGLHGISANHSSYSLTPSPTSVNVNEGSTRADFYVQDRGREDIIDFQ